MEKGCQGSERPSKGLYAWAVGWGCNGGQRHYLEGRAGSLPRWFWPLSSLLPREKRKGCSDPVPQPKGQRVDRAGGRREWNKSGAAGERLGEGTQGFTARPRGRPEEVRGATKEEVAGSAPLTPPVSPAIAVPVSVPLCRVRAATMDCSCVSDLLFAPPALPALWTPGKCCTPPLPLSWPLLLASQPLTPTSSKISLAAPL